MLNVLIYMEDKNIYVFMVYKYLIMRKESRGLPRGWPFLSWLLNNWSAKMHSSTFYKIISQSSDLTSENKQIIVFTVFSVYFLIFWQWMGGSFHHWHGQFCPYSLIVTVGWTVGRCGPSGHPTWARAEPARPTLGLKGISIVMIKILLLNKWVRFHAD